MSQNSEFRLRSFCALLQKFNRFLFQLPSASIQNFDSQRFSASAGGSMGASLACSMRKSDHWHLGGILQPAPIHLLTMVYHCLSIYLLLPQDSEISQHRSDVYMMSTDLWHGHLFWPEETWWRHSWNFAQWIGSDSTGITTALPAASCDLLESQKWKWWVMAVMVGNSFSRTVSGDLWSTHVNPLNYITKVSHQSHTGKGQIFCEAFENFRHGKPAKRSSACSLCMSRHWTNASSKHTCSWRSNQVEIICSSTSHQHRISKRKKSLQLCILLHPYCRLRITCTAGCLSWWKMVKKNSIASLGARKSACTGAASYASIQMLSVSKPIWTLASTWPKDAEKPFECHLDDLVMQWMQPQCTSCVSEFQSGTLEKSLKRDGLTLTRD